MRTAFIEALCEAAIADERIWLLTGDLGYSVLERFASRFPDRFVNMGVAEQNMTGVAAGLALTGKIVITYSIANFPTLRCLEQIRNDVCHHRADVKIVAVGGGMTYGAQGFTHHGIEDLAIMRALPHMAIVAPGDPVEAALATRAILLQPGPVYLRLGKAGETRVHQHVEDFRIGRALRVRDGVDVTIFSTGGMLKTAVDAADLLRSDGISAGVVSMHTVRPLDEDALLDATRQGAVGRGEGRLVTVEEHVAQGGLGGAVAETLARHGSPGFLLMCALESPPSGAGSQEFLRHAGGISAEKIRQRIKDWMRREPR